MISPPHAAPAPRIFYGNDGLRAGWSLLLFALAAALFFFTLSTLAAQAHLLVLAPHQLPTARTIALGESILTLALLAAALLMSRIERCPFSRYGFAPRRPLPLLLSGLSTGFLLLSLLIVTLYFTGHLAFDDTLLHGPAAIRRGLAWLLAFACVALQEEFATRGYIQFTLTRGFAGLIRTLAPTHPQPETLAFWLAAFLLSVCLFTAGHLLNSGETTAGIAAVALAGLTFAFSLWRTGSLWWAIGFHTTWDWAQSFLYGVPDSGTLVADRLHATHPLGAPLLSGASAGPEGSLFVLPTLLLACLILHLAYPRRPPQNPSSF